MADISHLMELLKSFQGQGLGPEKFVPEGMPVNVVPEFNPVASGDPRGGPEPGLEQPLLMELLNPVNLAASGAAGLAGGLERATATELAGRYGPKVNMDAYGALMRQAMPEMSQAPEALAGRIGQVHSFADDMLQKLNPARAAQVFSARGGTNAGAMPKGAETLMDNWVEAETPDSLAVTQKWLPLIEDGFYK